VNPSTSRAVARGLILHLTTVVLGLGLFLGIVWAAESLDIDVLVLTVITVNGFAIGLILWIRRVRRRPVADPSAAQPDPPSRLERILSFSIFWAVLVWLPVLLFNPTIAAWGIAVTWFIGGAAHAILMELRLARVSPDRRTSDGST
jgi:hypothetical protein